MIQKNNFTRDEFKAWLILLPKCVNAFTETFPPEVRPFLDFSPASLDLVGNWLIENRNRSDFRSEPDVANGLIGYVGATYRINLNGKWNVHIDEPDFRFSDNPVIEGFDQLGSVICPMVSIQKTLEKKTSWYMRVELEMWIKNKQE